MKFFYLMFFLLGRFGSAIAQKPKIDSSVYGRWPSVEGAEICNDGNYALYFIQNIAIRSSTLVIQSTRSDWKLEAPKVAMFRANFTEDSRAVVFLNSGDSLGLVVLGEARIRYIPHVTSYDLSSDGVNIWLAYVVESQQKDLVVENLRTEEKDHFTGVETNIFGPDGRSLVLQTKLKVDGKEGQSIEWVKLSGYAIEIDTIWRGVRAGGLTLGVDGKELAFTDVEKAIWFCKVGSAKATRLLGKESGEIGKGLEIGDINKFDINGENLFFTFTHDERLPKPDPNAVRLDVWSYTDAKLQSEQLKELGDSIQNFKAVINVNTGRVIQLQHEDDDVWLTDGEWALLDHQTPIFGGESHWNPKGRHSCYMISTLNGERRVVKEDASGPVGFIPPSPGGLYDIYPDRQGHYLCYSVATGITRDITLALPDASGKSYEGNYDLAPSNSYSPVVFPLEWLKDEQALLMRGQFDIWQVDPSGRKPPISLTNGYGRRHHIVFDVAIKGKDGDIADHSSIILTAFNKDTKENGFYKVTIGEEKDPQLLSMGPYLYDIPDDGDIRPLANFDPIKARDTNMYIVRRMTSSESPNYFCTTDFSTFKRLSDIHPERKYNWMTSELIEWKALDGRVMQGILYKPEDFDPQTRYPVIFYYYEGLSDGLNGYIKPELSYGELNIPWYVSNEYLVFCPDIHYEAGKVGQSVVNSVVSAAQFLSQRRWVNAKRMGVQGFSFGAIQTNILITRCHLFAAACSASGLSDFVSGYGELDGSGGRSMEFQYEYGQQGIYATLWQRPDLYINNSAIFKADQVTTPLLMMQNKDDNICSFVNGRELFIGLRRLGKKVWMLQYDDGSHGVFGGPAKDFAIRMQQFFDHYLKGYPAPVWMTQGIPAKLKGIETGLELDKTHQGP